MIPKYSVWLAQARKMREGWPPKLTLLLHDISEEVKLHTQGLSPMTKRNVAGDILKKVDAFKTDWKKAFGLAPMPEQLVQLGESARKEAHGSAGARKYEYVSCIGHHVVTGKFSSIRFAAVWNGRQHTRQSLVDYVGLTSDRADYEARILSMKQAVTSAESQYRTAHGSNPNDAKTLKVFMAPEFYFRGLKGAYQIESIPHIAEALRKFTNDGRFSDWLFVFGTVVAATFDDRMYCATCGDVGAKSFRRVGDAFVCPKPGCPDGSVEEGRLGARIDNVAVIQKGGESGYDNAHTVSKEYVSHIDFRRPTGGLTWKNTNVGRLPELPSWNDDRKITVRDTEVTALPVPGSRDLHGDEPSKYDDERMGGAIFTIDGIRFGLEICLDHLNSRLPSGTGVQIQLVPSAGSTLKQFACVSNGIAFNVDGLNGTCDARVNSGAGMGATTNLPHVTAGDITITTRCRYPDGRPGSPRSTLVSGAGAHSKSVGRPGWRWCSNMRAICEGNTRPSERSPGTSASANHPTSLVSRLVVAAPPMTSQM